MRTMTKIEKIIFSKSVQLHLDTDPTIRIILSEADVKQIADYYNARNDTSHSRK